MRIQASRKFTFSSGHRLVGHQGKCRFLHGHNYTLWVTFEAPSLNELGMVIDFSDAKKIVGDWLDQNWDHKMILWDRDDLFSIYPKDAFAIPKVFEEHLVRVPFNPTAEKMAQYLLAVIFPALFESNPAGVVKVVITETENCTAEASL